MAAHRSAMDWSEGGPDFDDAHLALDEVGAFARRNVPRGCQLTFDGSNYSQRCPVALAHNRVGFSPSMLIRAADCSVCQADIEECDHIPGVTYEGIECHRIIKDFEILDIFLVGNPAQPDARIQEITIPHEVLAERLGDEFQPGVPVVCDRCLTPCAGVVRAFDETDVSINH